MKITLIMFSVTKLKVNFYRQRLQKGVIKNSQKIYHFLVPLVTVRVSNFTETKRTRLVSFSVLHVKHQSVQNLNALIDPLIKIELRKMTLGGKQYMYQRAHCLQ